MILKHAGSTVGEHFELLTLSSAFTVTQDADGNPMLSTAAAYGITQEQADVRYVQKTGDVMSGQLTLALSGMSSSVKLGQSATNATYGMLSFNGVMTSAGGKGLVGKDTDNLYYVVPSGVSHYFQVNGSNAFQISGALVRSFVAMQLDSYITATAGVFGTDPGGSETLRAQSLRVGSSQAAYLQGGAYLQAALDLDRAGNSNLIQMRASGSIKWIQWMPSGTDFSLWDQVNSVHGLLVMPGANPFVLVRAFAVQPVSGVAQFQLNAASGSYGYLYYSKGGVAKWFVGDGNGNDNWDFFSYTSGIATAVSFSQASGRASFYFGITIGGSSNQGLYLGGTAGTGGNVHWYTGTTQTWTAYMNNADNTLYFRDVVNAGMLLSLAPGTGSTRFLAISGGVSISGVGNVFTPSYTLDIQGFRANVGIRTHSDTAGQTHYYHTGTVTGTAYAIVTDITASTHVHSRLRNYYNTGGTGDTSLEISTGGASGGDPYLNFAVLGVSNWTLGIDNSNGDTFVLNRYGSPSSGTAVMVFDTSDRIALGQNAPFLWAGWADTRALSANGQGTVRGYHLGMSMTYTGNADYSMGIYVAVGLNKNSCSALDHRGIQISNPGKSGSGTLSYLYGLRVEEQTGASINWGVYVDGGNSRFPRVMFADGLEATPSICFENETDLGFYRYTGNTIGVAGLTSFMIGGLAGGASATISHNGYWGFLTIGSTSTYDAIGAVFNDNSNHGMVLRTKSSGSYINALTLFSAGHIAIQQNKNLFLDGGTANYWTMVGTNIMAAYVGSSEAFRANYSNTLVSISSGWNFAVQHGKRVGFDAGAGNVYLSSAAYYALELVLNANQLMTWGWAYMAMMINAEMRFYNSANTQYASLTYALVDTIHCIKPSASIAMYEWIRFQGQTGVYWSTYGGGWVMLGSTYIEAYGSKKVKAVDFELA